jgi:hypothetical protein
MAATCAPWPADMSLCDTSCTSPTVTGTALGIATDILWALSGRQFGTCTETVRPCRRDCADVPWPLWPGSSLDGAPYVMPLLYAGQWYNLTCGSCGDFCTCTPISEVVLPFPTTSIVQVKINGTPLVTGAYRLDDARLLVRTDGSQWPRCNDLNKADTQPGTWSITYTYGAAVPAEGQLAVGELACEFTKMLNNETCRLPRHVTSVSRQGVTINYADLLNVMANGRTGLLFVDLFLDAVNPARLAETAHVYSVDHPAGRRPT